MNKGGGSLLIVLALQRGPESSSSPGPRPSIDGLVVCALGLGPLLEKRHPCCAALLTSLMVMLPSGPEPSISERSIPSSWAFCTAACVTLGSWLPPACSPCWS